MEDKIKTETEILDKLQFYQTDLYWFYKKVQRNNEPKTSLNLLRLSQKHLEEMVELNRILLNSKEMKEFFKKVDEQNKNPVWQDMEEIEI